MPQVLDGIKLLAVFISQDIIGGDGRPLYFAPCTRSRLVAASRQCRRTISKYKNEEKLVIKEFANPRSRIKPFPLQSKFAADDVASRGDGEPDAAS